MAKCRSSTPVRNKEQKIDRLLSFMFLRGKAVRLVRVRPSPLSLPPSPPLPPAANPSLDSSVLVLRTVDVLFSFSLLRSDVQ